jgi:hypothetical protein
VTEPILSSTVNKTGDSWKNGMWDGESEVWDQMIALAECGAIELQNGTSQKTLD